MTEIKSEVWNKNFKKLGCKNSKTKITMKTEMIDSNINHQ